MAKRSPQKQAIQKDSLDSPPKSGFLPLLLRIGVPLLLAVAAFLAYWPSLQSDFVYDARAEILQEGFITSLSNLPAVLSFKVLGMDLMLGDRPMGLLYMMLNAAIWGTEPFGYHLGSNLLHAANVALLFVLLCRLIAPEITNLTGSALLRIRIALVTVTLIFALHPIAVESVAEVSYSSNLLATLFTLLALLAATAFRPENFRLAMLTGCAGTFCAFASVASKESGVATALLLVVYWFLFRRNEAKRPWFLFLGAATAVTAVFLAARFLLAPPSPHQLSYLGGSFARMLVIQPRLWIFMIGKLFWPIHLSADYTPKDLIALQDASGFTLLIAPAILAVVLLLQGWLAFKNRLGALGVAVYWLGLATVSNFVPLFRPMADRFYYLPLAGIAIQLLALFLITLKSRWGFYAMAAPLLGALLPMIFLTLTRQEVFTNNSALWSDTLRINPSSSLAHNNLGTAFLEKGQTDEAVNQYRKALEIDPNYSEAHYNLGVVLFQIRKADEALAEFQKAWEIDPNYAEARNNFGMVLLQRGQTNQAMAQFQAVLKIDPSNVESHNNLGVALFKTGHREEALLHFQEALRLKPNYTEAQHNLTKAKTIMAQQKTAPDK